MNITLASTFYQVPLLRAGTPGGTGSAQLSSCPPGGAISGASSSASSSPALLAQSNSASPSTTVVVSDPFSVGSSAGGGGGYPLHTNPHSPHSGISGSRASTNASPHKPLLVNNNPSPGARNVMLGGMPTSMMNQHNYSSDSVDVSGDKPVQNSSDCLYTRVLQRGSPSPLMGSGPGNPGRAPPNTYQMYPSEPASGPHPSRQQQLTNMYQSDISTQNNNPLGSQGGQLPPMSQVTSMSHAADPYSQQQYPGSQPQNSLVSYSGYTDYSNPVSQQSDMGGYMPTSNPMYSRYGGGIGGSDPMFGGGAGTGPNHPQHSSNPSTQLMSELPR